ncbi:MAG: 50S ribosomal protein L10 [Candidatus Omnitrophota bacterium]|jgi:large subunit ribosomal protein L10|nr:MAG: 50S ribosomal protein L10 [Candidatus Omnitrophota bacterium]
MSLKRTDKEKLVEEYNALLEKSSGMLIFDYRGLTVEQVTELRNNIRSAGGTMRVVKNRMMKRIVKDKPYAKIQEVLFGPSAVIFAGDDPVAPAKKLVEFAKTHEPVKIKAGVVNEAYLDAAQVDILSKIPSKEQLYAKILGGIKAPASNILGCLKGMHQKLHGLMKAYADKLEEAA